MKGETGGLGDWWNFRSHPLECFAIDANGAPYALVRHLTGAGA
jgi:hypothetical protein